MAEQSNPTPGAAGGSVNPVPPAPQAKAAAMTRTGERPQGEEVLQEIYEPLAGPAAEIDQEQ